MVLGGYVACTGESRNSCNILAGKTHGRTSAQRPMHIGEKGYKYGLTDSG
jgi:hypothetical protein